VGLRRVSSGRHGCRYRPYGFHLGGEFGVTVKQERPGAKVGSGGFMQLGRVANALGTGDDGDGLAG
jgi:hypothetical protein